MFIIRPRSRRHLHFCVHYSEATDPDRQFRFSPAECERAIALKSGFPPEEARIEGAEAASQYRSATTHFLPYVPETTWVYQKLMHAAVATNDRYWNFDITGFFEPLQLVSYRGENQDHYTWHMDVGPGTATGRKVSVTLQLSAGTDYEGGELELNTGRTLSAPKEQGALVLFPSYVMHRVAPVTRGERWSLVGWVQGHDHFR
jgi:PKHD-type hydroxylase